MKDKSTGPGAVACSGAIYGFGIFGAWIYFWQQADGFWSHVLAIVEGVVWPAYLVYDALARLH